MKYYLAPMEGITGRIFRNAYHASFPAFDKYFTPFITPTDNGKLSPKDYNDIGPEFNEGLYVVPQILTNQADGFVRTAEAIQALGYGEINFNLGCPSGTVVSKHRGSGFLAYPAELDQFLYEIFSKVEAKISIKTRVGKSSPEEFEEILEIYNRYPLEELIIHPRVREDYYKGMVRMETFKLGMNESHCPVCYNGDIFTADDWKSLKQQFPELDRVMLGRGVCANPGLVGTLKNGAPVTLDEFLVFHDRLYWGYRDFFLAMSGQRVVLFKMKEIWCYLIAMFADSKKYEKKIKKAQSLGEYEAAVAALVRECPFQPEHGFRPPR